MIRLVVICLIGISFHRLARQYRKSSYLWVIIGVLFYYIVAIISGGVIALLEESLDFSLDDLSDIEWNLIEFPFCLLVTYGFYKFLKWQWSKNTSNSINENTDILDNQFLSED